MNEQIPQTPPALPPLTPAEEKQWAMIAYFSILTNLLSGFQILADRRLGARHPYGLITLTKKSPPESGGDFLIYLWNSAGNIRTEPNLDIHW
jgi:hypothetical protein